MSSVNRNSYCIVSFNNEEGVISLIPSIWLTNDKKECYWPPHPAGTAIKKRLVPSQVWTKVPIEIIEDDIGKSFYYKSNLYIVIIMAVTN